MDPETSEKALELDTLHAQMAHILEAAALSRDGIKFRQNLIADIANQYMREAMGEKKWKETMPGVKFPGDPIVDVGGILVGSSQRLSLS